MGVAFDYWEFLAGLMLFLLAMSLVEAAIGAFAGRRFKGMIARSTGSPLRGIVSGTAATAVLQSSSMVSLMMLAFVGARVIRLRDALLVVFGANLGTTATGWIVATIGFKLDLAALALPLIALGGLVSTLVPKREAAHYGRLVLGIGLLLLALQFMKGAVEGAAELVDPQMLAEFSGWQYLLFGTVFSALVQSSSATMVITLSLLNGGVIDLPSAAALAIGADLGTTSTVLLGAIGGSANKKRLAVGHFLFNLLTDLITFLIRIPLLWLVGMLQDPLLVLVAFHSVFNLMGLVLWVPLIGPFADVLGRIYRDDEKRMSRYLEETAQTVPEVALPAMAQEVDHLLERTVCHNLAGFKARTTDDPLQVRQKFTDAYHGTRELEGEILSYALDLERGSFTQEENERLTALLHAARDGLMAGKLIKDVIEDYLGLYDDAPQLYALISQLQVTLYETLHEVMHVDEVVEGTLLDELSECAEDNHRRIHEAIYAAIQRDVIAEQHTSSVLNINRHLFNSNQAMLSGLRELWLNDFDEATLSPSC